MDSTPATAASAPDAPGRAVAPEAVAPEAVAPEEVRSATVVLRRLRQEDAEAIAGAVSASLDYLRPWMPWANPDAVELRTQRLRVAEADELWEAGSDFIYSVLLAGDRTLVGEIGLHRRPADACAEIGYWIDVRHAGRGLGTEAARLMTQVGLGLDGVTSTEIHCDEANQASAAVARKLGYQLDRIDRIPPEAPGEQGRRMVWVMPSPHRDGPPNREG